MSTAYDYDIGDELTRKSGDAYSWLENEFVRGQLEPSAYYTALVALDLALLGLIPDSYSQWACEKRKELALTPDLGAIYAASKGDTFTVVRLDRSAPSVSVTAGFGAKRTHKVFTFDDSLDPYKAAGERYKAVINKLTANGFEEV